MCTVRQRCCDSIVEVRTCCSDRLCNETTVNVYNDAVLAEFEDETAEVRTFCLYDARSSVYF